MKSVVRLALSALVAAMAIPSAHAASIRVSPVTINVAAPGVTSSIHVSNDGDTPVGAQVRIFRWTQQNGEDVLEPTTDVVVSPPIATLQPGTENLVRIVRTAAGPVQGEESYRILIDQLPDPLRAPAGAGIALVVRQSIPIFFEGVGATPASVSWSVASVAGGYDVTATNAGATRLRVSSLVLTDAAGHAVGGQDGIIGYALGGSTVTWRIARTANVAAGATITLSGQGDTGPFNATIRVQGG